MTKKVVRPILPVAPNEYDPVYINQLARALEFLIDEVRDADVNFQGISQMGSATSLDTGDMYIADAGFLKIVQADDIFATTNVGTTAVGSVTVAVS
jgi:hypothetical protein|tara:strand:+ start:752 stop:1039 length:288 start_codon:yes stop_codon:yes gene_type:complete